MNKADVALMIDVDRYSRQTEVRIACIAMDKHTHCIEAYCPVCDEVTNLLQVKRIDKEWRCMGCLEKFKKDTLVQIK